MRIRGAFTAILLGLLSGGLLQTTLRPVVHAQENPPGSTSVVDHAVRYGVSPRAGDLPADEGKFEDDGSDPIKQGTVLRTIRSVVPGVAATEDAALQASPGVGALLAPAPSTSFQGLSNQDNFNSFGFRVSPPDTDGDVGPDHYVQQVNLLVRVFDKAGTPLTAPFRLSNLWSGVGGQCAAEDAGDPIVLYDPLAGRWLLSQFAFATSSAPPYHQCIAISQTSDPTGAYFLYDFVTPGANFPDYPKLGVWPDAYYMTTNQFLNGASFDGAGVFAFDRAKMLAGDPTASFVYFNLDLASFPEAIGGMLPSDHDGLVPPPPGAPNVFAYFIAGEFGDPSDGLRLFDFHVDFANPAASSFSERSESPVAVAAFDPRSPAGRDDIEQPPPASTATASLDSISDRLMHRLAYRNFGSHESLVVTHTVNVGPPTVGTPTIAQHQAGVRYYELRRSLGGGFAVQEQASFAPDSDNRWMGSAAIDHQGNIAVGYSVSSLTTFPSIRYAGRLASDPPGGLFQGETTLVAGSGVQTNTGSRWGDYSALAVDPADECTFWFTQEYYTAASQASSSVGWLTRIGSFKFPGCDPALQGTLQGSVTNLATGLPLAGATVQTTGGFSRLTGASGLYSMTLAPGLYDLTASRAGFQPASASGVLVSDATTTLQNFGLTPVPVIMSAGAASVSAESCSPATGGIDPGEVVSVELSVKNSGAANTSNLVGALHPTGGVVAPGPPQSFGVVTAGGPAVSRTFSFTADSALPCGSTLVATLSLQDGPLDLGTLSYELAVGTLGNVAFDANYGTGDVSIPIPDLGTVEIPIAVPDTGVIGDVDVRLRLNHTFDADLDIFLVHPDGTEVELSTRNGGSGDNYGSGPNDCSGSFTVFDDAAATAITSGAAPFAASFRPEQPLATLNGKPSQGSWRLRISDRAGLDVGTVGCAQLQIKRRVFLCCPFLGGTPAVAAAPPAAVVAESCSPGNGAPDPDETVTVSFPLQNLGTGPTGELVATLLPSGGVNAPSGPQSYGALSPVGPPVARSFSFVPSGSCGSQISATLQLRDGGLNLGQVSFALRLGGVQLTPAGPFSNPTAIAFPPDTPALGDGLGPATPYPSTITVSGLSGSVSKVTATLRGLTHTFPADLDFLLVGPQGQSVVLMSDVGGGTDVVGVNLSFDDAAPTALTGAAIVSGTYRPSNIGTGDPFPAPAPPPPHGAALSVFSGSNPNGSWSLYAIDDAAADSGSVQGGWELNLVVEAPLCCSQPCSLACSANVSQPSDPGLCDAGVAFASPAVTGSCGVVACDPPSGGVFPVGVTRDTCIGILTSTGLPAGSCGFDVTVLDLQPPIVTASLTPVGTVKSNHGMFRVGFGGGDNCPGPSLRGVMAIPPGAAGFRVVFGSDDDDDDDDDGADSKVIFDFARARITLEGGDRAALLARLAQMLADGGAAVSQNQQLLLKLQDKGDDGKKDNHQRYEFSFRQGMLIGEKAPQLILRVRATDASGNVRSAEAVPTFPPSGKK